MLHLHSCHRPIYAVRSFDIYVSMDDGDSWQLVNHPINGNVLHDFEVHPTDPFTLWATTTSYNGARVLTSNNGGVSWTDISGNLPAVKVYSIIYQNGTDDQVYVGTDLGVFYTDASSVDEAGEQIWTAYHEGMPRSIVFDLEINYCEDKLYAGTHGRGLWEADLLNNSSNSTNSTINVDHLRSKLVLGAGVLTSHAEVNEGARVTYLAERYIELLPDFVTIDYPNSANLPAYDQTYFTAQIVASPCQELLPLNNKMAVIYDNIQNGGIVQEEVSSSFSQEEVEDLSSSFMRDFEDPCLTIFGNPAGLNSMVSFELMKDGPARLLLLDQNGRLVQEVLQSNQLSAGTHQYDLDVSHLHSGLYFLVLYQGNDKSIKTLVKQ